MRRTLEFRAAKVRTRLQTPEQRKQLRWHCGSIQWYTLEDMEPRAIDCKNTLAVVLANFRRHRYRLSGKEGELPSQSDPDGLLAAFAQCFGEL